MGIFINIELGTEVTSQPDLGRKLAEICPVDIFAMNAGGTSVDVVERNVDECVLCDLCIQAAPSGSIRILKLYE
jgi:NAD-dependent dihydropyrimidine dehydrogenase PreA subunit